MLPRSILAGAAAFAMLAAPGFAQTVQATLSGTVTDPTGAVISGAQVTATEIDQGTTRTATTNATGLYSMPEMLPGTYRVSASAPGFEKQVTTGVNLQVQQAARVDFHLAIGQVSNTVEVAANAATLNTDDSVVGQVIQNRNVVELPLNGRNYLELAQLTAGVAPANGSRTADSGGFSALGQHGYQTRVVLDGIDNSSQASGGQIGRVAEAVQPSVDAVQEFKVVTNNNSAEYGLRMGGTVIVSLKSGTNQIHGDAFEFLRNDALDAANFFAVGQPKPPFRQNEFGGTLGGPIRKDRTFFFASYDGTRQRESVASITSVPSAAQLAGNFSGMPTIYDPLTTTKNAAGKVTRTPFAGNIIPAAEISPIAAGISKLYPAANLPGATNNYYFPGASSDSPDEVDSRLDHNFSQSNRAFVRYSRRWDTNVTPGTLPLPADGAGWTNLTLESNSLVASLNSTLSPSMNNDLRVGYSLLNTDLGIPTTANLNQQYGITGTPDQPGMAAIGINGFASLGSKTSNPNKNNLDMYQIADDLLMVRGRHTVKVGFSGLRDGIFRQTAKITRGQMTFDGSYTDNPATTPVGGAGLADFLLGDVQKMQLSNFQGETAISHNYSAFVQDDWRLNHLTLNLGMRWDFFGSPTFHSLGVSIYQFTPGSQNYNILHPNDTGDCGCSNATRDFAPRIGAAYEVRPGTVVRSGFGIFYGMPDGLSDTFARWFNQPPTFDNVTVNGDKASKPATTLAEGFPAGTINTSAVPANVTVDAAYGYMPTQYSMEWFTDVQQQIGKDSVLTLSYLGSGTRHMIQQINVNQPAPGAGTIASRSPYPYFNQVLLNTPVGNASYDGFTVKFEKHYSRGLMVLGSYTWAHAIDNVAEDLNSALGQAPENNFNIANQRSDSVFDMRNRFVASLVYDLPFGHGRAFLNRTGPADWILGGWQISGIVSLYAGNPFAPLISTDLANTGSTDRPNRVGNGNLPADQRTIADWFNLAAFTVPAVYTYGNSGRNVLVGPGTRNIDAKIGKNFTITERWHLQFRAEFFNAFNTPNFLAPNPNIDLPQGGTITSAQDAREIQLGLKLLF